MRHIVLGNPAGDADSIVSTLAWAFVETLASGKAHTPIVSISREDLEGTRPETSLLLKWAGVSYEDLIYMDELPLDGSRLSKECAVTLMDHNQLVAPPLLPFQSNVVEIHDHHLDEGHHMASCQKRNIAFRDGAALVASTCTLVVERLSTVDAAMPYPEPLSTLLLGVILLDSVNLNPAAGKVTPRDRAAVNLLLEQTTWAKGPPETSNWFEQLQQAKFNPEFWKSLSVKNSLRLDYKEYAEGRLGISSVLTPVEAFLEKPNVLKGIKEYMLQTKVEYLIVMLAHDTGKEGLMREIVVCSETSVESIVSFLVEREALAMVEQQCLDGLQDGELLKMRVFSERNTEVSRKVIAPILMDFFSSM